MAKSENRELKSRLIILIQHFLKYDFQLEHRSNSWISTIEEQRKQIHKLLDDLPNLNIYLPKYIEISFSKALTEAIKETELRKSIFPMSCPYSKEQLLDNIYR
jgi:hypothetical protein